MAVIFLITTLKPDVRAEDYEAWVHERDYPFMAKLPNVISYEVHRIDREQASGRETGWMYLERIELVSREQHERDLATEDGQRMREELYRFLDRPKNISLVSDVV